METILSDARADKKKIKMHKIIWSVIFAISIILPFIFIFCNSSCNADKEATIVSTTGKLDDYYEYINTSSCTITLTFDIYVDSGYVQVEFYDKNGKLLADKTDYFYAYSNEVDVHFYSIDGKVSSYDVVGCYAIQDLSYNRLIGTQIFRAMIYLSILILAFFISALLLTCKIYEYNGNIITVYAGWSNHFIKVNGVKADEHNTFISYSPIYLSTHLPDGTYLQATISTMNRISLKINNVLYTKEVD